MSKAFENSILEVKEVSTDVLTKCLLYILFVVNSPDKPMRFAEVFRKYSDATKGKPVFNVELRLTSKLTAVGWSGGYDIHHTEESCLATRPTSSHSRVSLAIPSWRVGAPRAGTEKYGIHHTG